MSIQLTFTQCKQIKANCDRMGDDWQDIVERMQEQPEFISKVQSLDLYDIKAIIQGGCESGAYMPAVTYYTALETMNKYSKAVEQELEASGIGEFGDTPVLDSENTWSSLAVYYVSLAVELWCGQFVDYLEDVDFGE